MKEWMKAELEWKACRAPIPSPNNNYRANILESVFPIINWEDWSDKICEHVYSYINAIKIKKICKHFLIATLQVVVWVHISFAHSSFHKFVNHYFLKKKTKWILLLLSWAINNKLIFYYIEAQSINMHS